MACISPPELEETTLLTYLDGEADSQVVDHLDACSHCSGRADRLHRIGVELRAGLYRADCPASFTLGRFHLQTLPDNRRQEVVLHLESCPHCQGELEMLEGFLDDFASDVPDAIESPLRLLIARLLGPDPASREGKQLALATQRGESASPLIYAVDGIQISLSFDVDAKDPTKKAIFGLLTGLRATGWLVKLIQNHNEVAETAVDHRGNFVISTIDPGEYELVIGLDTTQIRIETLDVGD